MVFLIYYIHLPFSSICRRMVQKLAWEVRRWQALTPVSTYCRSPPFRWPSSCSSITEKSALSRWGQTEAPLSRYLNPFLYRLFLLHWTVCVYPWGSSIHTTLSLLSLSIGDPAGDRYSWKGVSASAAVFGLREANTESPHQGAKVQGDWERPCVYRQWSVYFQTAQSQNTDRWAQFVYNTEN